MIESNLEFAKYLSSCRASMPYLTEPQQSNTVWMFSLTSLYFECKMASLSKLVAVTFSACSRYSSTTEAANEKLPEVRSS